MPKKIVHKKEDLQDIKLIERIVGVKFKKIPKIYLASSKKIKKKAKLDSTDWVAAIYKIKENEVYLNEDLKRKALHYFDFEKAHEFAHALFFQHSLAFKQFKKGLYGSSGGKSDEEIYIIGDYLFDYLLGKVDSKEIEENRELLDFFTFKALSEGFAHLVGRLFLIEKYGIEEGFIKGLECTYYDHNYLKKMPPSLLKLKLILSHMGATFADHYFTLNKSQDVCRYFLNISKEELPELRKKMKKLYSRLFED
jgi:hypothetical protein